MEERRHHAWGMRLPGVAGSNGHRGTAFREMSQQSVDMANAHWAERHVNVDGPPAPVPGAADPLKTRSNVADPRRPRRATSCSLRRSCVWRAFLCTWEADLGDDLRAGTRAGVGPGMKRTSGRRLAALWGLVSRWKVPRSCS